MKLIGISQPCSAFKIIYFIIFYVLVKHNIDVLSIEIEKRYIKFYRGANYLQQK